MVKSIEFFVQVINMQRTYGYYNLISIALLTDDELPICKKNFKKFNERFTWIVDPGTGLL